MGNGKCSTCKVSLSEENSSLSVVKRNRGMCRLCTSKSNKKKYYKNPEKYRAMSKIHRLNNPNEYKEYQASYRKTYRPSVRNKYCRLKICGPKTR